VLARVARYRMDPDRCDEAVESFRRAGAQLAELGGFRGGYVLLDSTDGEIVTVTLWESREALEASDVRASHVRAEAIGAVEGSVESVGRYDVAIEL
jgi:heme-degrading monooxygenase HmoA